MSTMELYENIKKKRKELNMTQQKLADLTGYGDRSSIAKIESGSVDLSQSKIELFAKVLHTSPGELMGWENSMLYRTAVDNGLETIANIIENQHSHKKVLNPNELIITELINELNDDGQEKLIEYATDLVASGRYKKHNLSEVVEGA